MQENWIVPCSVKFFNIVEHFENNKSIVWRKVSALREGDVAYIYVGAPYSQIMYKCHVVNGNVGDALLAENKYAIRSNDNKRTNYVQLELDFVYPNGALSLDKLRENGLGQTQKQARMDRKLQAFINEINSELNVCNM